MSQAIFHIYVLSNGRSGLYRSLLSLWKLESYPSLVTILCQVNQSEIIEKSIFTVSEDTGLQGPETRILESRDSWRLQLVRDAGVLEHQKIGFLVERDMFLPKYAELISGKITLGAHNALSHFQRQKFGNSKLLHPVAGAKVGLSALVISKTLALNLPNEIEILDEVATIIPEESNQEYRSSEPMVLVQSNIKSAYEV